MTRRVASSSPITVFWQSWCALPISTRTSRAIGSLKQRLANLTNGTIRSSRMSMPAWSGLLVDCGEPPSRSGTFRKESEQAGATNYTVRSTLRKGFPEDEAVIARPDSPVVVSLCSIPASAVIHAPRSEFANALAASLPEPSAHSRKHFCQQDMPSGLRHVLPPVPAV
jgi:hypothetical protein